MRLPTTSALTIALLMPVTGCDDIVDSANLGRGPVEVENGTRANLQRLYHPRCGEGADGPDRLDDRGDLRPGDVLEIDLPSQCVDFRADFSNGQRRIITNVTPDPDQRQRITFR
ncbi:MAG TPA: hypothetical protein VF142_20990 [Longimicrobium sp.]